MMVSLRYVVAPAYILALMALPGCQKSPMSDPNQSQSLSSSHQGEDHQGEDHQGEDHQGEDHQGEDHQGEDHQGEDHHEHLEHFVPPHKPASFEELVSQLAFRCETLPKLAAADEKEFQKRSVELRDIIQWIPELSADSNLKRQEFETAVEQGKQLLQSFESSDAGRTLNLEAVQKNLDVLKSLVPDSIEPVPTGQTPEASVPSSSP